MAADQYRAGRLSAPWDGRDARIRSVRWCHEEEKKEEVRGP